MSERRFVHEIQSGKRAWPPRDLLPLLGLAQHNGLETRLLDWSRDPLTAAYFASVSAAERIYKNQSHGDSDQDNEVCVWVMHWEPIEAYVRSANEMRQQAKIAHERLSEIKNIPDEVAQMVPEVPETAIRVDFVTVPTATNQNLRAQQGVFSLLTVTSDGPSGDPAVDYSDSRPLDQALAAVCPNVNSRPGASNSQGRFQAPLTCVTLPSALAPHVLFCLAHLRVSGASLFPGFGGVASAVREQKLFPKDVVDPRGKIRPDTLQPLAIQAGQLWKAKTDGGSEASKLSDIHPTER
jgi:hypothetical protein